MSAETPLVSVIVPIYNGESYLDQTLTSILNQTYNNWECVIVDDGSKDSSPQIAREFAERDPRFVCIVQPNAGVAGARNTGIAAARGELIAFLDQDDLWLPRKLEICMDEFLKGDQDLIYSQSYIFHGEAPPVDFSDLVVTIKPDLYHGNEAIEAFLYANQVTVLTVVARKQALLAAGGFHDMQGADDYLMWLEMLFQGNTLRGLETPLTLYRMHEKATSATDHTMSRSVLLVFRRLYEKYPDHDIDFLPYVKKMDALLSKMGSIPIQRPGIYSRSAPFLEYALPFDRCQPCLKEYSFRKTIPESTPVRPQIMEAKKITDTSAGQQDYK